MMMRFKGYTQLKEGKYPIWLKVVVGGIVMKIRNLQTEINGEKDLNKQNELISQQNTLLSYISGLGIGGNSNDRLLMNRMRKGMMGGRKK